MRDVCERSSARASGAMYRLAAVALLVTAVACFTAENKNESAPTGVIGPTGGGGTNGGGGGALYAGSYALQDVDDSTLPFQLAYDSVSNTDSTRVFQAFIDSSKLFLNTDSSAEEMDYLTIRDVRTAADSNFNRVISFGDTLHGTFSSTASTITVNLTDTVSGIVNVTYTVSGSTFSGTVPYVLYNTINQLAASGQADYLFAHVGPPLHAVDGGNGASESVLLRRSADRVGASRLSGAAATSNVRQWRVPASALRAWPAARARTRP